MILVIASVHSMRGDLFVALMFLGVVWLLAKAFLPSLHFHGEEGSRRLAHLQMLIARAKQERGHRFRTPRRTLIITPSHKDPLVVGDVTTQAHWPKG